MKSLFIPSLLWQVVPTLKNEEEKIHLDYKLSLRMFLRGDVYINYEYLVQIFDLIVAGMHAGRGL
jgi:hypothetical protein